MSATPPRYAPGSIDWLAPRQMPALDDLSEGLTTRLIVIKLRGSPAGPQPAASQALLVNAVRTTDKAVAEYEAGRLKVQPFERHSTSLGGFAELYRATDHLENCVTSTIRALRFVDRLRRDRHVRTMPKSGLPDEAVSRQLRNLRNAIEHNDGQVVKGIQGELGFLGLLEDRMELQGIAVSYVELADCLRCLHANLRALLD